MRACRNTWAVVLAAGDGTRLATLTTDPAGNAVPKQFCSLDGGRSLLEEAVSRASKVVPAERVYVMVSDQHRRYWARMRWAMREANTLVQPTNCGTAHGILLAVLAILARDPFARILFLPADHHVRDESALASAARTAVTRVGNEARGLAMVGIEPEEPDPDLGYIVPGRMLAADTYAVLRFVEKPDPARARELLCAGALWNSFIFAADGPSLLGIFRRRMPDSVEAMATALARADSARALREMYATLPSIDFSSAITQGSEQSLSVVAAPLCGWSDLGTPKRLGETLRRLERLSSRTHMHSRLPSGAARPPAFINLAAQHARLGPANLGSTP
ncbi:MAG: NTP transferase domain-containing protein [Proteobacteria bacterium]|nr:NTP transferase domain-containing protein [Pseudomonadota bacterium]